MISLYKIIWIGLAVTACIISIYYGMITIHIWLRTRFILGKKSREAHEILRKLLKVSRQANRLTLIRLILFYCSIGMLIVSIVTREWMGLIVVITPLVLIKWMDIRTTTVPVVLMLGTSTHSSIKRQREIKAKLAPLRVVSLLDIEVPWDTNLAKEMEYDCFRTTNEDDWWLVITNLMEIAPILAIDTAADTTGVLLEGQHILGSNLRHKCLFLTPPDRSAPVLDHLLPIQGLEQRDLRMECYEKTIHALNKMVAELRF